MEHNEITRELLRIQALNGGLLRAVDVVEEARHPASPLHDRFNWDDTEAAHQWRLQQARQLIRVKVEYLPYQEPRYEVRAFVSLMPDRQVPACGYRVMAEVLSEPARRQQLLGDALAELNRWRVKYFQLTELDSVFRAMERIVPLHEPPPPPETFENGGAGLPA